MPSLIIEVESGAFLCYHPAMGRESCIVCAAPPDVLACINDAIRKKEKFRSLAARTGYSRAGLHRHSQRCLPHEIIAAHRSTKYIPQSDRVLVKFKWQRGPKGKAGK